MRNDELTETLPGTEIPAVGAGDEYARPTSLEWLLSEADFVSLHAKWTPETEGMMGGPQFARMKPNAFFINTARGALVDEVALLQALKERRIAGAALDVFGNEPEIVGNPLLGLPNVIATPHIGRITPETMKTQAARTVAIVQDILAGKVPEGTVNVGEVTHPRLEGLTEGPGVLRGNARRGRAGSEGVPRTLRADELSDER